MPLTYHPEFAAAAGAALEMRKTLPQPPVGDIEGRCNAVGPIFEQILRSIPPSTGVTRDIYECSGNLGRPTPIHHHYPTDPSKLAGPIGAVIVYVHGGGMYLGSIDWFHHYISRLVSMCGVPFISVEYGLAPEHRAISQAEDCYAAIQWIH